MQIDVLVTDTKNIRILQVNKVLSFPTNRHLIK